MTPPASDAACAGSNLLQQGIHPAGRDTIGATVAHAATRSAAGTTMPAYLVGAITVRDPERWAEYVQRVGPTFVPHGGELLFRGTHALQLAGSTPPPLIVTARFPTLATLRAWHDSADYQALVPLRDAAADVALAAYEG